ncbi:MAG: hypothetical protein CSA35_09670 [Dethiosulfovibrio peptidovorans]|nr:MAG: hypothetical protein CSA35_09670 [Dethiosulfovibrio peptidovorans]
MTDPDKTPRSDVPQDDLKPSFLKRFGRNFATGLLVFLPLAILIFILRLLIQTVTTVGRILFGITDSVEASLIIFGLLVIIITYAGSKFARRERWTLNSLERAIVAIPLVGSWYETIKDLVGSFTGTGKVEAYLGVVAIPVGAGSVLGFVTRRDITPDGTVQLSVFMPTSPNPTSGIVFFVDEKDVEHVNMSPEHAFKTIISLGIRR